MFYVTISNSHDNFFLFHVIASINLLPFAAYLLRITIFYSSCDVY